MDYLEAIKVIDDLVFAKAGRHLNSPEKIVIEAAWLDLEYKEIAESSPYNVDYLQRGVGRSLWILLTGIVGNGEKVTKKRLRGILEKITTTPSSIFLSDTPDVNQFEPEHTELYVIGGQPPDVSCFYGRTEQLTNLREWIAKKRCVVLHGAAGIGKSALVAKLIEYKRAEPKPGVDCLIWKSIPYAPPLQDLVTDLLLLLARPGVPEPNLPLPEYTQARISVLIEYLRSHRCLLVLDAAESLLQGDRNNSFNPYGEQYADYGLFFRRLVEEEHQSCLILISREPFLDMAKLQRSRRTVQSLKLEGLDSKAAREILRDHGLNDEEQWADLLESYLGNPSAIELAASRIKDFFGGSVAKFMNFKTSFASDIFKETLDQQFGATGRLTNLEKQIMLYLAESLALCPSSIAFTKLLHDMKAQAKEAVSTSGVIEALSALGERSLIEIIKDAATGEMFFSLQPVVKKYVLRSSESLGWEKPI